MQGYGDQRLLAYTFLTAFADVGCARTKLETTTQGFGYCSHNPLIATLVLATIASCSAVGQVENTAHSASESRLGAFVKNRPPISFVKIRTSWNRFALTPDPGREVVDLEGALQNSGFYVKWNETWPEAIDAYCGESGTDYWTFSKLAKDTSAKVGPGASANNGSQIIALHWKEKLESILALGFEDFLLSSLVWTTPTNCTASLKAQICMPDLVAVEPRDIQVSGLMTLDNAGRPKLFQASSKNGKSYRCQVTYQFDDAVEFPPSTFVLTKEYYKDRLTNTNQILALEIGPSKEKLKSGYFPAMFSGIVIPQMLLVWSNGACFQRQPDGALVAFKGVEPPSSAFVFPQMLVDREPPTSAIARSDRAPRYLFIFLTTFLIASIWWLIRWKKQKGAAIETKNK